MSVTRPHSVPNYFPIGNHHDVQDPILPSPTLAATLESSMTSLFTAGFLFASTMRMSEEQKAFQLLCHHYMMNPGLAGVGINTPTFENDEKA